ncbi:MAG: hypothetical protein LJU34_03900 [Oscillospiraceae bacterium]|nr:hypothetical protein [Oscillospiraceae bacterium]
MKVNIGETTNYGLTAQNITIQDSAVVSDAGTGSKEAIYANGGNLTIQDSATVKTESRGINATYQVSISGNANVTVTNESGNGINAGTGITVLGKAIVTATGKYGLNCRNGDVVLEGTVTATATNSNA